MVYSARNYKKKGRNIIRVSSYPEAHSNKEKTHPEHCEAVDDFGETKVGNLDDGWVIPCKKDVLQIDSV